MPYIQQTVPFSFRFAEFQFTETQLLTYNANPDPYPPSSNPRLFEIRRKERTPHQTIISECIYSVSQKKSPLKFSDIFPKRLGIFSPILHTYYAFLSTLDYKFLFSYLQL